MNSENSFQALPLAAPIQRALRDQKYTTPSPIQAQTIPHVIAGRDIIGVAQTGTGKTAAFALPILHRMQEAPQKLASGTIRALVLTPTRELAEQVARSFNNYGRHLRLTCGQVFGGVSAVPQIRMLRKGVDVLVATPGRLLDLYRQGHLDFGKVEFLVLDEADRMLDMGFIPDIRKIVAQLPRKRQSLFFSATISPTINRLAETILCEPVEVRVAPKETMAEKIDHRICFIQPENKFNLLCRILNEQKGQSGRNLTLVFSRTKQGTDRLARMLKRSAIRAETIHGNKTQGARQRALESFRQGRTPVLIATDVAARGIDVRDITLVINFDLPDEPEAYVHRIGRTARAGSAGYALSFCTEDKLKELRTIEKLVSRKIEVHIDHPYHFESLASRYENGKNRVAAYAGKPNKRRFHRRGKTYRHKSARATRS